MGDALLENLQAVEGFPFSGSAIRMWKCSGMTT